MALLEEQTCEATEQLRPLRPNVDVLRRSAKREQIEDLDALFRQLFEHGSGGWCDHVGYYPQKGNDGNEPAIVQAYVLAWATSRNCCANRATYGVWSGRGGEPG